MAKFKNITVKKRGGGTRLQRVQVLASGKYKFVKNPSKRAHKTPNPRPKKARKVRRRMARRKRSRRSRSLTIPLATVSGALAMIGTPNPSGSSILENAFAGDMNGLMYNLRERFTCVDNTGAFRFDWIIPHYGPLIFGALISKFVGGAPLNLNRKLAAHKIPFLRI